MRFVVRSEGQIRVRPDVQVKLQADRGLWKVLPEAMSNVYLPYPTGGMLQTEVEMGRIVGRSHVVEAMTIGMDDPTYFAQRIGQPHASRVFLDTVGLPTSRVAIIAKPAERPKLYDLLTAYIGDLVPREPWDTAEMSTQERHDSCLFWTANALVHNERFMGQPFLSTWNQVLARRLTSTES